MTGAEVADFSVSASGLTGASVTGVSGSGTTRSVSASTGAGNGTIRLDVVDDDSIIDASGNKLGGTGAGNGSFATGEAYTVSRTIRVTILSTGSRDGWVRESRETGSRGSTVDAGSTTLRLGDDSSRRQYRSVLSFATGAGLPDNAVITRVTLRVRKQGVTGGGNPVSTFRGYIADIRKGPFGSTSLHATDFQAAANASSGPTAPALVGGWYSIDLTGRATLVNRSATLSGVTQVRLRFRLDDNGNRVANYLSLYSGNAPAASRPQLVIEYHLP